MDHLDTLNQNQYINKSPNTSWFGGKMRVKS